MLTPAGFPPTSPALGGGLGPLGGGLNLGAVPPLGGGNLFGGPQDGARFSPDAGAAPGGLDLSALLGNFQEQMDPKQVRIQQLNQEIQMTQGQLQQAQAQGDQQQVQQLEQKLQQLQQELQQLMGGDQAGAGGGEAGGAPGGGGGDAGGIPSGGGGNSGGGGDSGGGGIPSGGGGNNGGGAVNGPGSASAVPNPELAGNDAALAASIEKQLEGTPLGGQGLGAHFVQAGRERNVDPLALVAISKHETNHGKLGVGVKKHMGVGAYDANPNGKTPFDGAVQQIYSGAKTFDNLRRKGGSNPDAPMSQQLAAVNRAGWATDSSWHKKVGNSYNTVVAKANSTGGGNTSVASNSSTSKPSTPAPAPTRTASTSSGSSTKKA